MRIRVLGQLAVEWGGTTLSANSFPTRQTRLVLAYLAVHRDRVVTRGELTELLWPDRPPAAWQANLSAVVSKLRLALSSIGDDAAAVVASTPGGFRMTLDQPDAVDLHLAQSSLHRAPPAVSRTAQEAWADAAAQAVVLLRGGFLPGERGHWVESMQDEVDRLLLRGLELMGEAALALGDADGALAAAAELTDRQPLREVGHRLGILAHLLAGDRAGALRSYDRCRRLLAEELGVPPSPGTESAHLRALAATTAQPPLPPMSGGRDLPFVGRSRELAVVAEALDEAQHGPRLVLVEGEPGIGKTRLVVEAARRAHGTGTAVLFGRCDRDAGTPYGPIVAAFDQLSRGCGPDELAALAGAGGRSLARLVPALAVTLGGLPEGGDPAPEAQRYRLFEAVGSVIERLASTKPVLLVVDDAHWADHGTLLLLRHLARTAAHRPLLVLATCHVDPTGRTALSSLASDLCSEGTVTSLKLGGLGPDDLAHLTGDDRALRDRLSELTAGNPLFVRELLHQWDEDDGHAPAVTSTVRDVVRLRLGRLTPTAAESLVAAAVAGLEFDGPVLAAATGGDLDRLTDALDEAVTAGLVTEDPQRPDWYRFTHGVVRDALYTSLSRARRGRLHHHLATAVTATRGDDDRAAVEVLHHLLRSSVPADAVRAMHAARRAADLALGRLGYEEAATHLETALTLAADSAASQRDHADLLLELGEARVRSGHREAVAPFLAAAELGRALGEPVLLARAALGVAATWRFTGEVDQGCVALLEEALEALPATEPAWRARLLGRLAEELYYVAGTSNRREQLTANAVETARRCRDPLVLAAALQARNYATWEPGRAVRRLAAGEAIMRLAAKGDAPEVALDGQAWRFTALLEFGSIERARQALDDYEQRAANLGQPRHIWYGRTRAVTLAVVAGAYDEALALADQALAYGCQTGQADADIVHRAVIAPVTLDRGGPDRLEDLVCYATRTAELLGRTNPSARYVTAVAAAAAARWGEHRTAADLLTRLDDQHHRRDLVSAATLSLVAGTAGILADRRRAEAVLPQLQPLAGRHAVAAGGVVYWGAIDHWLGITYSVLGRCDDAEHHLDAAIRAHDTARAQVYRCTGRLELAKVVERRRPADAARLRAEATAIATSLAIPPA